ncbi:hypothetical protein MBLNU230_g8571t1 [Neophaeotheca triangularis]
MAPRNPSSTRGQANTRRGERHVRLSEEPGTPEFRSPRRNWDRNASPNRPALRHASGAGNSADPNQDQNAQLPSPESLEFPDDNQTARGTRARAHHTQRNTQRNTQHNTQQNARLPSPDATHLQEHQTARGTRAGPHSRQHQATHEQRGDSAVEITSAAPTNKKKTAAQTQATAGKAKAKSTSKMEKTAPIENDASMETANAENESDVYVCEALHDIRDLLKELAESVPNLPKNVDKAKLLDDLVVPANKCLVRYIGCLAMGGSNGVNGWRELYSDDACRQALVHGVVGRALKETAFSKLWFGAAPFEERKLHELEVKGRDKDGFYRTEQRAAECARLHAQDPNGTSAAAVEAQATLFTQLQHLVMPLFNNRMSSASSHTLADLVNKSFNLARHLRLQPHSLYHWTSVFKDEEFDPSRMEVLNLEATMKTSPYETTKINGINRAVLKKGQEHRDEAIVRVVCLPALSVYRRYGGALSAHELATELERTASHPPDVLASYSRDRSSAHNLTGDEGYRSRPLGLAVVHLQWGKQRLLTKEAGTSAFLAERRLKGFNSKYEKDYEGFTELWNWAWDKWDREGKLEEVWDASDQKEADGGEEVGGSVGEDAEGDLVMHGT